MGPLTNDMARLRDDIDTLHNSREAFINDLKHDVAETQSNFRNARAEMARKLVGDLTTFVSGLKADVSDMQEGFRNDHAEMARKLIDDLRTFASDLNKNVASLRQKFAADIQGSHRAWFGQSPAERTTKKETERNAR